jgi:hypothetical protein
MRLERRQLMLGGAAIVALALTAWTMWPAATPPTRTTPAAQARARGGKQAAAAATGGPADPVNLDALKASREDPSQAGRNPFRYQPKAAPPPPKVVPAQPVIDTSPRPTAPTGPVGPPPPTPIPLKFTGLLTRADGTKWAVLTDGKSPVMYGKEGEIIDGKYLIVKIGTESIEMTHADGRGRQVIRLTGQ